MKDILILQGKKYISAKRASTISDYTSDYIGQLCRANKLECTRIGHAWFVNEESLFSHKAKVAQDLADERMRYHQVAGNQISNKSELEKYREHGTFLPQLNKTKKPDISEVISAPVAVSENLVVLAKSQPSTIEIKVPEQKVTSPILRAMLTTAGMLVIVSVMFVSSLFIFTRSPRIVAVGSSSAGVYDALQSLSVFFKNKYLALRSVINHERQLAINTSSDLGASQAQGMAVVSSTGTTDADVVMKQQIQESFSDAVEIHPDASGTGGVITPVFRTTKGDDFVYVLVPVKEKEPAMP